MTTKTPVGVFIRVDDVAIMNLLMEGHHKILDGNLERLPRRGLSENVLKLDVLRTGLGNCRHDTTTDTLEVGHSSTEIRAVRQLNNTITVEEVRGV